MRIADRTIGIGQATLVIAEIGVNHDGSLRRALELVELAAACGADAVKLQIFTAATLMHPSSQFAQYQQQRVDDQDPLTMLRRYELSVDAAATVVAAIRKHQMLPIATPFSPDDAQVIARLDLPAVKIASPDLVNRPLLDRCARLGIPLLVSTGAATLDEIETTCDWLRGWRAQFALLHCVSSYPTTADDANLCWIGEMNHRFAVPVGFSDHTTDVLSGALAVAAGATIVEKHFTYDRRAKGPDHSCSADPEQFNAYVRMVRQAEELRGMPGKRVLSAEQDVRRVSRQSLVALRDLQSGEELTADDVTVQRPGTGISAAEVQAVVGRRVARAVQRGTLLQWDMLANAA